MAAVPGYPHLRWTGGALKPAEEQVSPATLSALDRVGRSLGKVIDIFSGSGGPSVRGAGFTGDPHDRGIAVDANIDGQPIGDYPGAVAVLHAQGLRSGATDFTYQGRPDPAHVDTLPFTGGGGVSAPSSISTLDGFLRRTLTDAGLPATSGNIAFLEGWSQVEGTAAKNNPLATTLQVAGKSAPLPGNSAGVQQYVSPEAGAAATAQTLKGYPSLMAALKTGSPVVGGITAGLTSDLSRWSGGGGAAYTRKVFLAAQGNPNGNTAADIGSYDLSNIYTDSGVKGAVDATLAVPRFLSKITDPAYILRGLQVVAGGGLVLVGVVLLARQVALAADLPDPAGVATKTAGAAPLAAVE